MRNFGAKGDMLVWNVTRSSAAGDSRNGRTGGGQSVVLSGTFEFGNSSASTGTDDNDHQWGASTFYSTSDKRRKKRSTGDKTTVAIPTNEVRQ